MVKINFEFKKKSLFVILAVLLILSGIFGGYAIASQGHDISEISPLLPCSPGSLIYWDPEVGWHCLNCPSGQTLISRIDTWNCIDFVLLRDKFWVGDEDITVLPEGNVGIGMASSSSYRLSVNGPTYINGEIIVGRESSSYTTCSAANAGTIQYYPALLRYNTVDKGVYGILVACVKSGDRYEWREIPMIGENEGFCKFYQD